MVSIEEIQAAYYMVAATGVLVAAAYYIYNTRINQRMMKVTQDSRKAEVTNNILNNLQSLESWKAFFDVMNLEWKDFEDFAKKMTPLLPQTSPRRDYSTYQPSKTWATSLK